MSYWIRVALNSVSDVPKEERHLDTETQKKKAKVVKGAKAEVIFLQAKECLQPPEARKRQRRSLP